MQDGIVIGWIDLKDNTPHLVRHEGPPPAAAAPKRKRLTTRAISIAAARAYVREHHRHLSAPLGGLFAVGCFVRGSDDLVGVAIVGRPTARMLQSRRRAVDGPWRTVEVTRCATDGTPNACSALYGACLREARRRQHVRVITYTLPEEGGASLRGAGFRAEVMTRGGEWHRPGRARRAAERADIKTRWSRRVSRIVRALPARTPAQEAAYRDYVGRESFDFYAI
jgi:hypothetical protein